MSQQDPPFLRPISLRAALLAAGNLQGRRLSGVATDVALADLVDRTCLGEGRGRLAGRHVLLATTDQFITAVALSELDGLAARIVLCPPDLKSEAYPSIIARAGLDSVVTDLSSEHLAVDAEVEIVRCVWPSTACVPSVPVETRTEWLLLTSGTTGLPKMVQHSFAGLTAAIKPRACTGRPPVWATFYDMRRYGGLQIFLRGMLGTGSMVLSSTGEPIADFLHRLGRAGVTHISGTPSHWRRALMSPAITAIAPDYVRLSGEIADQTILDSLRQAFPKASIGHAYASTEAGVGFEVDDGHEGFPAHFADRDDGDVAIKIADGSLRLRSARTASRYVGSSDMALADADGFIDTGDMVELREGRYHFVGRRGGIINVGGLKVHPEEVESVINRHPKVRMSLVEGRRNPITGAIVIAAIVLKDAGASEGQSLRDEVLMQCRAALPPHKVPAMIRIVPSLDVTAAGKMVRAHA